MLGGSSAINLLAMVYPSRASIDTWARLGNRDWDWEHLLPYYWKFISYNKPSEQTAKDLGTDYFDESLQGRSGPIQGTFAEFHGPLSHAWLETFEALNLKVGEDQGAGNYLGGLSIQSAVDSKTMERSHAGSAYYEPIANRSNLHVFTETVVEKILLNTTDGGRTRATGVQISRNNKKETKLASREVLLCAGVFQSPQLLELSGIGSSQLLKSRGIDIAIDNPDVGENLQDHPVTGVSLEVADGVQTIDMIRDPEIMGKMMEAYATAKTGPLSAPTHSVAYLPVVQFISNDGRNELQQILKDSLASNIESHNQALPSEASQYASLRSMLEDPKQASGFIMTVPSQLHFEAETHQEIFAITEPGNYFCLMAALTNPFSRGNVHIASALPGDLPLVDPRYLTHPLDLELLARHLRYCLTITSTKPFADYFKPGGARLPQGLDASTTIDAAKEHCRRNLISNNHPCGTCSMLPLEAGGVVNDRLRVYGVEGLRVVDASIFPMIPAGNIQTTVYAVAERAADLIKQDQRS